MNAKGRAYRLRVQEPGTSYYLNFSNSSLKINGEWLEVWDAESNTITAVFPSRIVTYCMIPSAGTDR